MPTKKTAVGSTPTKRGRKPTPMTGEHKAALAAGRDASRAVRNYLEALESHKPKRGRPRTPESVSARLAVVEEALTDAAPMSRLALLQEQIDLKIELPRSARRSTWRRWRRRSLNPLGRTARTRASAMAPGGRSACPPKCCAKPASRAQTLNLEPIGATTAIKWLSSVRHVLIRLSKRQSGNPLISSSIEMIRASERPSSLMNFSIWSGIPARCSGTR